MPRPENDLFSGVKTGQQFRRVENSVAVLIANARVECVPVDQVGDRRYKATRSLDPGHVLSIATSIVAIKHLIQPIATDSNKYLVAGGHRLAALRLLSASPDDRVVMWTGMFGATPKGEFLSQLQALPVRSLTIAVNIIPFDSATEPDLARQIEVMENEKRKDYTHAQVSNLIQVLKEAGYQYEPGRPTGGGKALGPTLMAITGKSRATVERYLKKERPENPSSEGITPNPVDEDKRLAKSLGRWLTKRREALNVHPSLHLAEELLRIVKPVVPEAPPPQVVDGSPQVDCF